MVRRVLRRLRRASSLQCVLVLFVLLGAWSRAAAYDPVLDPLRGLFVRSVTRFVTRSFRGTLEVGALRGSLLGSMVLQNIMLRDEQGIVVGQIAELHLNYDPKALLHKRLYIQTAEVVRLQLTLVPEPDGSRDCSKDTGFIQPVHDGVRREFVDGLRLELHATYLAQDAP